MTTVLDQSAIQGAGKDAPGIPLTNLLTHAAGNEADVEVYANFTGFLWETAKDFNALVVFAEVAAPAAALCYSCI